MLSLTACPDSSGKSRLSADKAGNEGKKFFITCLILSTVFFTYTVDAQEGSFLRKPSNVTLPEKIQGPLGDPIPAGTYSIGTGGYFPTIDSAFNKLSIDGVAGNVTLELIDELYIAPATQFGFLLNGPIPGAGATSRVTIKPAENKNVTIQGDREAIFYLLNTSYVTVDGFSITGPTTLTIHSLENITYEANHGIYFVNDCDNNVIQNVILIAEDFTRQSGSGFWQITVGGGPDSNLIQNNFVKKAGVGLFIVSAYAGSYRGKNNIIRGNIIGSETDSLISYGLGAGQCENTIMENNIIQNLKGNLGDTQYPQLGIISENGYSDIIRNNVIYNMRSSSGWGSIGILLGHYGNGINNEVYNNMIYDIQSTSIQFDSRVVGIQLWYQTNPKIYYNTVYLSGTGTNKYGSAALYFSSPVTNADVKNNIFVNTRDESPYSASAIYGYITGNLNSDYNDLYYEPSQNSALVKIGNLKYNSLSAWQATGKDFHSVSVMPCFSGSNLHIDVTEATCLESRGTPIPGFDTDFDGEPRHQYLPDIGADEFDGIRPSGAITYGAYSVGNHGFFTSIENVFDRLSSDGVDAAVTLELIDELYVAPAVQFGFQLNGPIPGAGPNSRVTIKPAGNKNVTIQGNREAVMYLVNTSYVTFDGVSTTGSTKLTIHAQQNSSFVYNDCLTFINNSDHNVIQNITFIGEDYARTSGCAGFWFTQTGSAPDSNLIQNNLIKKGGVSIFIIAASSNLKGKGNIVRGNQIGSEADSLISVGIEVQSCENTIVENNIVQNLKSTFSGTNQLKTGIYSEMSSGTIIRNNVISNLKGISGFTTSGIVLQGYSGNSGNDNLVYNNMIYDIQSSSTQNNSRVAGIQMEYQNNPKIYYNSVYLSGTGANQLGSAALYIYAGVSNADIKNNILVNTRDESPYCASAIYNYTAGNFNSDYNDLYYEPNQYNALLRIGGVKYNTLADWQATGKDLHSVTEMPNFIPPYLHIAENEETLLESRGIPIAGINVDFDGQTRHATNPDIGADEFNGIVVSVDEEEILPTEYVLLQNYPNPFNPSTKISWQSPVGSHQAIKVFDVLGNQVATLVDEYKPAGRYEIEFSIHSGEGRNLSSGIYFYQLKVGEYMAVKKMILIK